MTRIKSPLCQQIKLDSSAQLTEEYSSVKQPLGIDLVTKLGCFVNKHSPLKPSNRAPESKTAFKFQFNENFKEQTIQDIFFQIVSSFQFDFRSRRNCDVT